MYIYIPTVNFKGKCLIQKQQNQDDKIVLVDRIKNITIGLCIFGFLYKWYRTIAMSNKLRLRYQSYKSS
jgi:hypothetical protein